MSKAKMTWRRCWRRLLIRMSLQKWVVSKLSASMSSCKAASETASAEPAYYGVFNDFYERSCASAVNDQLSERQKDLLSEHYRAWRDVEVKRLTEYRQWQWDSNARWSELLFAHEGALAINVLRTVSLASVAALGGFFGLIANFKPASVSDVWVSDVKSVVLILIASVGSALLAPGSAYISQFFYTIASTGGSISWIEHNAVADRPDRQRYEYVGHIFKILAVLLCGSSIALIVRGGVLATDLIAF